MRRKVECFNSKQITKDVLLRIKNIVDKSKKDSIDVGPLTCLDDLCSEHNTKPDDEWIVLGEDWVVASYDYCGDVIISLWAAEDNVSDKFGQIMEMKKALTDLLVESYGYTCVACMQRDTSYRFYESLLTRGYLEEEENYTFLRDVPDDSMVQTALAYINYKFGSINNMIQSFGLQAVPSFFEQYMCHQAKFTVTDKFMKVYARKELINR